MRLDFINFLLSLVLIICIVLIKDRNIYGIGDGIVGAIFLSLMCKFCHNIVCVKKQSLVTCRLK